MTHKAIDLAPVLSDIYALDRDASTRPTVVEMLNYLADELPADAEEDLRQRLALHPEASRQLLDLADPTRLSLGADVDGVDEDLPLPDPAALKARLHAEGILQASATPSPGAQPWLRQPPAVGVHPAWRLAAAALLVLSTGLAALLVAPREPQSTTSVAIWELLPRSDSGPRDQGWTIEATPGFTHDLLLYENTLLPNTPYRLRVLDVSGQEVLHQTLSTQAPGQIVAPITVDLLPPGRYELHLFADSRQTTPLAIYDLNWRRP